MASTLINTIAQIPSNPNPGDIIRFGAVITTGIPNTIKKGDGATTENRIGIGNEYRWYGTNWLKIGGDSIETIPLKDATILDSSEFENMIMAAVHNGEASGRLRKFGVSILHQALQAANPLELTIEETTIFQRAAGNTISVTNSQQTFDLDIKSGTTRHSFADGYFAYVFFLNAGADLTGKDFTITISQQSIDNLPGDTDNDFNVAIHAYLANFEFRKISNTRMKVYSGASSYAYSGKLYKIVGLKLVLSLETE